MRTRSSSLYNRANNDENAAPLRSKNSKASKNAGLGKQAVTRRRPVLSDITNHNAARNKEDRIAKKRAVDQEAKPEDCRINEMQAAGTNLNDALFDMDMKEEASLEQSVAHLNIADVDAADAGNPQMVAEYINDIMVYLKRIEGNRHPSATYMTKQKDINARMREILIDWLVEVHYKFKLRRETLFLTINVIDRFLERRAVSRTKLQLVGCTAMLIASKYEEIYAPEVRDFVYISDRAYTSEQILAMESIMLNTLGFHLTVPSTLRFGERFCRVAELTSLQTNLVHYLMELTCQEYKFLKYLPSMIASAAVYLAKIMTNEAQPWTPTLEAHTTYDVPAIRECVMELYELANKQPTKYRAVRKKYANKKFDEVSNIPPVMPCL